MSKSNFEQKLRAERGYLEKCLVALYEQQTAAERMSDSTQADNGKGFNVYDAKYGSYMARWVKRGTRSGRSRFLTGKHRTSAFDMLPKYWGQFESEAKTEVVQPVVSAEIPFTREATRKPVVRVTNAKPISNGVFDSSTMDQRFFMLELD